MKPVNLINLLFLFFIYSCSNNDPIIYSTPKNQYLQYSDHSYNTGITIVNGPRQGFQYVNPFGEKLNYRYITTTISNDSIVPVNVKIAFGKEYDSLRVHKLLMSDVFLLPRSLTPKRQQFDANMSKELRQFLDTRMGNSESLKITLNPKEQIVMTFGVLTKLDKYDPFTIQLTSGENILSSLTLVLGDLIKVPCGQLTFPDKF